MADTKTHDLVIIGAGPAGLAASVYASRYKLENVVVGPELGGYVSTTHLVEDYLGYASISGMDLAKNFVDHATGFGAETLLDKVDQIKKDGEDFVLHTWSGLEVRGRHLLLATGTKHNKLGVPGEDTFEGKGVSYCVTCDAAFFKDKPVVLVGGGDSALKGVLHLSEFASQVYLIHRRDDFRAEPIWVERVQQLKNVTMVKPNRVVSINGEQSVTGVTLAEPHEGSTEIAVDGVFIEIGSTPDRTLADLIGAAVDDGNFIRVNDHQRTSVENVWAAGDNTTASAYFRQIGTAASEGSIAAGDIYEYKNDARKDWHAKGAIVTE